jgi:hypothetical protein
MVSGRRILTNEEEDPKKTSHEKGLRLDLELSEDTPDSQMAARREVWDLHTLGCI